MSRFKVGEGILEDEQSSKKSVWVCPKCNSINVEQKVWMDVNFGKLTSYDDEYYCSNCSSHLKYLKEVTNDQLMSLLSKSM